MQRLQDLPTPCLVLDEHRMQRNIDRMDARAKQLGVPLRPHLKTPKSVDVARRMVKNHNAGVTVSTLREAEHFADHGLTDIFYAVPLAPDKVPRVAALHRRGVDLSCATHSLAAVEVLAARAAAEGIVLPLLIDVDIDHYRSGVEVDDPEFLALARAVDAAPSLALRGIMIYAGASYECTSTQLMGDYAARIVEGGQRAKAALASHGLPCDVVSYGSSPGTYFARSLEGVTESRAGVYVFQDLYQAGIGACEISDIAVWVTATVTGHKAAQNRLIIDAGGLALSKDVSTRGKAFDAGYGLVCDIESGTVIPDLYVSSTSQEVALVTTRSGAPVPLQRFPVGTKLRVLPNHSCFTAAAHDQYHVVQGGDEVVARWARVNGW
ncbi:MAG TPA: alanine racemase [Rubrivivax sp.]|nr:alanine racemase [Rubrivivax sp.]